MSYSRMSNTTTVCGREKTDSMRRLPYVERHHVGGLTTPQELDNAVLADMDGRLCSQGDNIHLCVLGGGIVL